MVIVSKITNIQIENDNGTWKPKCVEVAGTSFIKIHTWEYGFYKLCHGTGYKKGTNKKNMAFIKKLIKLRRAAVNAELVRPGCI